MFQYTVTTKEYIKTLEALKASRRQANGDNGIVMKFYRRATPGQLRLWVKEIADA